MKAVVTVLTFTAGVAQQPRRLAFDFGTLTADPSNPASLGGSAADPSFSMGGLMMPQSQDVPMLSPEQDAAVTKHSANFVQSAVKAFLNKTDLPPEEMKCLEDNSGTIGSNVGRVAEQMGLVLQKAFKVDLPLVPDAPTTASASAGSNPFDMSSFGASDDAGSIGNIADKILKQSSGNSGQVGALASPPSAFSAPAPAPVAAKTSVTDASLGFFYNQGRRLQMLPGLPESSSSSGGFGGLETVPMVMELGMYSKSIMDNTKELVDTCIHSDAKAAFEEAGRHATSLQHIAGHFLANGADVVDEFADMVVAYDAKDSKRFGTNFGTAMRKIFLSNNTKNGLPEGLPSKAEMSNVSAGFLRGFFGPGTSMTVSLDKDPTHPLSIDMKNCVERNTPYFQQVWGAVMYLFGKKAAGVGTTATTATSAAAGSSGSSGMVNFGTTLAFSMMELPQAMSKCGISDDQRSMIMDSVKSLGSGMDTKVSLPHRNVASSEIKDDFAQTVEKWAKADWFNFGHDLGALMQESAVKFYPKKYSVDFSGVLHRQLVPEVNQSVPWSAFASVAAVMAIAPLVVRVRRNWVSSLATRQSQAAAAADLLEVEEGLE